MMLTMSHAMLSHHHLHTHNRLLLIVDISAWIAHEKRFILEANKLKERLLLPLETVTKQPDATLWKLGALFLLPPHTVTQ